MGGNKRKGKNKRKEKGGRNKRKRGKGKRKRKECRAVSITRNWATRGRFPPTPVIFRLGAT